jgi:hypothetical protein
MSWKHEFNLLWGTIGILFPYPAVEAIRGAAAVLRLPDQAAFAAKACGHHAVGPQPGFALHRRREPRRGPAAVRALNKRGTKGTLNFVGTEEKGTPDTFILYKYLKHFGSMCSSHTSTTDMGTDWRNDDPVVEPVVEIYQGHRHNYEFIGAPRSATKATNIGGY